MTGLNKFLWIVHFFSVQSILSSAYILSYGIGNHVDIMSLTWRFNALTTMSAPQSASLDGCDKPATAASLSMTLKPIWSFVPLTIFISMFTSRCSPSSPPCLKACLHCLMMLPKNSTMTAPAYQSATTVAIYFASFRGAILDASDHRQHWTIY